MTKTKVAIIAVILALTFLVAGFLKGAAENAAKATQERYDRIEQMLEEARK